MNEADTLALYERTFLEAEAITNDKPQVLEEEMHTLIRFEFGHYCDLQTLPKSIVTNKPKYIQSSCSKK